MTRQRSALQAALASGVVVGLVLALLALFQGVAGRPSGAGPIAHFEPSPGVSTASPTVPSLATAADESSPYPAPPYPPPRPTLIPLLPTPIEEPTPTIPPVPTPFPTPVVTPIPTAAPPFIPAPPGEPEPYTVAFRDGNVIRAVDSHGANERVLVDIPARLPLFLAGDAVGVSTWGSPSPDGNQLALVLSTAAEEPGKGETPHLSIHLFDLPSGALRPLVEAGVDPVWSPDGTRIAYQSTESGGLWVVEIATGTAKEVFPIDQVGIDRRATFYTWSPEGTRIALVKTAGGIGGTGEVWIVDTTEAAAAYQLVPGEMLAGYLNWAPAEDQLLFVSRSGEYVTPSKPFNLWTVDVATGERRQVTQNMFVGGGLPIWTSDAKWIVFSGVHLLEDEAPPYDLWAVASDGSELKRLTADPADDLYPAWGSDRSRVVFKKSGAGIWEVDAVSGVFRQVYPKEVEYVTLR